MLVVNFFLVDIITNASKKNFKIKILELKQIKEPINLELVI